MNACGSKKKDTILARAFRERQKQKVVRCETCGAEGGPDRGFKILHPSMVCIVWAAQKMRK